MFSRSLLSLLPGLLLGATPTVAQPPDASCLLRFDALPDSAGVPFVLQNGATPRKYLVETMLGGVALFDLNNDGFIDLFFTNGAELPEMKKTSAAFFNRLYRNNRDGTFSDVTGPAGVQGIGYSMGVAAGDYDNDGFSDLYATGVDANQLLHNNGDGTFSDYTERAGLRGLDAEGRKQWAVTAGWFDYDNDGLLDLLVCHYLRYHPATAPPCQVGGIPTYCHPDLFGPNSNRLYKNNGNGTFRDVTTASGLERARGKGMGVAFADYDDDGFMDVFVSNDTMKNFLFHNLRGTFEEVSDLSGVAYIETGSPIAGMGADFRDVDNDGQPDIFQTAMTYDTFPLFRNLGGGQFSDHTNAAGLSLITSRLTAYGVGLHDFDNDGDRDIFTANGAILDNSEQVNGNPSRLPNSVFENRSGVFRDVSAAVGEAVRTPGLHRGAAFGDLDNDGRVDVVVSRIGETMRVLLNRSVNIGQWISFQLKGKKSNRDGIGARIRLMTRGGGHQYGHVTTCSSYSSSNDRRVHFGLGKEGIESVEILWPSGRRQVLTDIAPNRVVIVEEPD